MNIIYVICIQKHGKHSRMCTATKSVNTRNTVKDVSTADNNEEQSKLSVSRARIMVLSINLVNVIQ